MTFETLSKKLAHYNLTIKKEEENWKDTLPSFTTKYLLETFPEAKELLKEKLLQQIEQAQEDLSEALRIEREGYDLIYRKSPQEDEWFWNSVLDTFFLQNLREGREQLIKKNLIYIAHIEGKGMRGEIDIERAKEYPINELINFKGGKACCIFHHEKSPSLKYYAKDNHCHCFGCNRSADSIDVYMQLHTVSFIQAVKALQ